MKSSAGIVAGIFLPEFGESKNFYPPDNINIIGPLQGYSPQIGTFVSMLHWIRDSVLRATENLTQEELDYLHDSKSNTIGALLLHLAATEVIYQDLTFNNLKDFSDTNKKKWNIPMNLGEEGRKQLKGNDLQYYLTALKEVRETTLAELKEKMINGSLKLTLLFW